MADVLIGMGSENTPVVIRDGSILTVDRGVSGALPDRFVHLGSENVAVRVRDGALVTCDSAVRGVTGDQFVHIGEENNALTVRDGCIVAGSATSGDYAYIHWRVGRFVFILTLRGGVVMGGLGSSVPPTIDIDFTALSDGALPATLTGSTWTISGGAAVNTPSLGSEMLTDPGLEATYTAGKCDTLTNALGTWTLTQSADVHGGSKAQQILPASANGALVWTPSPSVTLNQWYEASVWAKRTAGTNGQMTFQTASTSQKPVNIFRLLTDAAYAQKRVVFRAGANASFSHYFLNTGTSYDTVIVDDGSVKPITFKDMLACNANPRPAGLRVRGGVNLSEGVVGVASHIDDPTNPTNGIFFYIFRSNQYYYKVVEKVVNGTWSTVIAAGDPQSYSSYVANKIMEIRPEGSNAWSFWYDGVQYSTNQTISDASIISNHYYSPFAAGGSRLATFFCG